MVFPKNRADAGNPDLDEDGITWENDPDDQDPDGSRLDIGAIPYFQDGPLIFSKQPESLIVQKGEYLLRNSSIILCPIAINVILTS